MLKPVSPLEGAKNKHWIRPGFFAVKTHLDHRDEAGKKDSSKAKFLQIILVTAGAVLQSPLFLSFETFGPH